ncbi:MAG: phenylacetate--CoA ligase family protein [Gammaproteobacteria bacterium]|nr:MAG: phenylacetate--CoA ligase family protein [Gammaproteobacteria bacterium]
MSYRKDGALEKKGDSYYHQIECASEDEIIKIQEEKLQAQMAYLSKNSKLYQQKFEKAGIRFDEIKTLKDLAKVPFTVKQDLRDSLQAAPPFGLHQTAPLSEIVQMQASSGTTGSPAYVALTENDIEMWNELSARGFYACGVNPGDFVLHGFSMSKGFVGGIPCMQAIQYMGAIDVPVGADGGVDRLLRACADIKPRVIIGAPNFLLHIASMAPDILGKRADELGVERLVVGGEPGGGIPAIRESLEEKWGAKVCEMMGGTDLGVIYWAECDEQDGMHMICQDHIIVELIDPETEQVIPFEKGVTGELIYTAIGREASPVVRFKSGDHIVVTDTACSCGRTGPKIRCFGRTDDMLIVRGINVFPSAIQDLILQLQPDTNGVMRVWADFEGHTTQANLKVLVERGIDRSKEQDQELISHVEQTIRNALSFKAKVIVVDANSFEKPGVAKVALTLREQPGFLTLDDEGAQ